jgi:hypothetical protein
VQDEDGLLASGPCARTYNKRVGGPPKGPFDSAVGFVFFSSSGLWWVLSKVERSKFFTH